MKALIRGALQSLTEAGLINLLVLKQDGTILAAEGARVSHWSVGESVLDRLFVLAGLEEMMAAMAQEEGQSLPPLELPAVFLGGNHEDGEPGLSLRLSPLSPGRLLLLLRPLESAGAMDQLSVQQHNDLALLRGQLESAQSQAELNVASRETLFDTLRWGFRSPLVTLVQGLKDSDADGGQEAMAQRALDAVDDWLELLSLKASAGDKGLDDERFPLAMASLIAALEAETGVRARVHASAKGALTLPLAASPRILLVGLKALVAVCQGPVSVAVAVEDQALLWTLDGVSNGATLSKDHRFELARSAALHLGGSLLVKDARVVLSVPLG